MVPNVDKRTFRVLRFLLRPIDFVLTTALLAIIGIAVAIYKSLVHSADRKEYLRHLGVLYDEPKRSLRSEWSSRDPEQVFDFLECAFTTFVPMEGQGNDDEPGVYALARSDDPTVLTEQDAHLWDRYHLDNDSVRTRYREQVQLGRLLVKARSCLYCGSLLRVSATRPLRLWERELRWNYTVRTCTTCGWWCVTHLLDEDSWFFWSRQYMHAYAVMRRYDPLALETPLALARDYLARNPRKLANFDPYRFEELMADCLADALGDHEIIKIGGRKDRGIDIKAVRRNGETTLIEVKRRGDFSRKESVAPIRALHGVMLREGIPRGMVISTAHDFSSEARNEVTHAARTGILEHYSMELLPLADVIELLHPPDSPSRRTPWEECGIHLDVKEPGWETSEDWIDRSALPVELATLY